MLQGRSPLRLTSTWEIGRYSDDSVSYLYLAEQLWTLKRSRSTAGIRVLQSKDQNDRDFIRGLETVPCDEVV